MPREELDLNDGVIDDDEGGEITHENGNGVPDRLKAVEQAQTILTTLLSDPDIAKVVQLKKLNKPVRFQEEVEEEAEEAEEPTGPSIKDLAEGDPAVEKTLERIDKLIMGRVGKLEAVLEKLGGRIEGVEKFSGGIQQKEVAQQVDNVSKKYKDFGDFQGKLVELSKNNPGLNVEELYLIAKTRAGKLKLDEPSTFSEKPQGVTRNPTQRRDPKAPRMGRGRNGFTDFLRQKLEGIDLNPAEE